MGEMLIRVAMYLPIGSMLAIASVGTAWLAVVITRDCWSQYRRDGGRDLLAFAVVSTWMLVILALIMAGGAMTLWEAWRG